MDIDLSLLRNNYSFEHNFSGDEWKGAVLFLVDRDYVYLIKRSESMPSHSGQIAFFGGHKKDNELTPEEVALREFEEETSLPRSSLDIYGVLKPVYTARLTPVIPVLAELKMSSSTFLNESVSNGEWDLLLAYNWKNLFDKEKWYFAWRNGLSRSPVLFHNISKNAYQSKNLNQQDQLLWGATAQMIWNFLKIYHQLVIK